jgi:multidrug efflux pump subunit AcrA (membrane-fusion protein)
VFQIERGDAIQFHFNPEIHRNEYQSQGDTIGFIYSNELIRELAILKKDLALAKSNLNISVTGEKESIVNEARKQLELAKERANVQKSIMERQKELVGKNLIAYEIYEMTVSTYTTYKLEVEIAEAYLKSILGGVKPEQVDYYLSEINSIEQEIKILQERINQYTLVSPINGRIFHVFSYDTLFLLGDTSMVAIIPVNSTYYHEVFKEQNVIVDLGNLSNILTEGKIIKIDNRITLVDGKQVFTVIAQIENYPEDCPVNLIVGCTIIGKKVLLINYIIKFFQSIFKA